MDELRDKVADTIGFALVGHGMVYAPATERNGGGYCYRDMKGAILRLDDLAGAILALPEIAEALAAQKPFYIFNQSVERDCWPFGDEPSP